MDRREQKTLKALHEALISLLLKKRYESITIQEIIDTANVGRSTFYTHFKSKDELWRSGFAGLEAQLRSASKRAAAKEATADLFIYGTAMFEHANEYRDVFRALVGRRAGAMATTEIRRVLTKVFESSAKSTNSPTNIPTELAVRFAVDTLLSVLKWWLIQQPRLSPSEADALFRKLVRSGLGRSIS
jgi:AcrR family transcriptional regulator